MKQLHDKTAVVTGAASGIGLAISHAFAAAGVRVMMTDLNGEAVCRGSRPRPSPWQRG